MPAYNEVTTIGSVLSGIHKALDSLQYVVIVTCDRCSDGTDKVASRLGAVVNLGTKPGMASAFRSGVEIALGYKPTVLVHIDSDGQYDPQDILKLLTLVQQGCNLAIGDRIHTKPIGLPWGKYLLNKIGSLCYSIALHRNLKDMTSGLRAFTPEVARLPIVSKYTFTQEQIWRTVKAGYKIKFTPIAFYRRMDGKSRLMKHPLEYIVKSARDFRRFAL